MVNIAVYCRVSTDSDDQVNSLESQQKYFMEYISRNPEWNLTEIYTDKGLTGTSTRKRAAFNKMISDAEEGRFSLILTKEVSRFARNTVDALKYTRKLKSKNIAVYFILDNISTLDPDAELRLTIMASIAQEESRKTSQRVKWGQKRRMEQGVVFGRDMLGFDVRNGKLHINQDGAEIVRLIFHKFVREKKSTLTIARELMEEGYRTLRGNYNWTNAVIMKIIKNEKYCGDLIQKKTYTPNFLTHSKKYNNGEEELVVIRNHHCSIVSRELWESAQNEIKKRSRYTANRHKYSCRYPLSGKIFCAECGNKFTARTKKRKDGSIYKAWRCFEATKYGAPKIDKSGNCVGCTVSSQIADEHFMIAIQESIKELIFDREKVINSLYGILKIVFLEYGRSSVYIKKPDMNLSEIKCKKEHLLDLYLNGDLTKEYYKVKKKIYEKQESDIQKKLSCCDSNTLDNIIDVIRDIIYGIRYDESFYKTIVEKIIVKDKENIDIFLSFD